MEKFTVGIIANPQSGKDIRRLVSRASVFDNEEKSKIVEKLLSIFNYFRNINVFYMDDSYGIVKRAKNRIKNLKIDVEKIEMNLNFSEEDSTIASSILKDLADIIVVIGGDGTHRAVVKGLNLEKPTPIIGISTGTNNAFPQFIEPTIVALGIIAISRGFVKLNSVLRREKILKIFYNNNFDIALVDLVFSKEKFIGSKAIWNINSILSVFTSFAEVTNIGFSSIPSYLSPSKRDDPFGSYVIIGSGKKLYAPIVPGEVVEVSVDEFGSLMPNSLKTFNLKSGTVALDGERKIEIYEDTEFSIELSLFGPYIVDVKKALEIAVRNNGFLK